MVKLQIGSKMEDIDKYKKELAERLAPIISKEGLTDVTDWIEKNARQDANHNGVARSVAFILEATGDFQREELADKTRYYVKRLPRKPFKERYPSVYDLTLIILGATIGLASGYFQNRLQNDKVEKQIEDINRRVKVLSDSLNTLAPGQNFAPTIKSSRDSTKK